MNALRQAAAVVLLPGIVTVLVPALIVGTEVGIGWAGFVVGVPLIAVGPALVIQTVALFARVGRGTLAPWDPTSRLVVHGPYRYVRNPMISGVIFILLGEAALFSSLPLLVWFGIVSALNAIYLPLVEEPGLRRRFGAEYELYRTHVPRWIPRVRPWTPANDPE